MGPGGRSRQVQPMVDLAQVAEAASKLSTLLDQVCYSSFCSWANLCGLKLKSARMQVVQYVEEVLAERAAPNDAVGRQLLELTSALPDMAADTFADAFNSGVKDLLMVSAA